MRGKHTHPTREGLDRYLVLRVDLYRCQLPGRLRVPILVEPSVVNDDILAKVEIDMAV